MSSNKTILLTGATGYIGKRLALQLLEAGHTVYALVRNTNRLTDPRLIPIQADLTKNSTTLPVHFDAAYYLIHSMKTSASDFDNLDEHAANNFLASLNTTSCKQIIYLTGLANDASLSKHLASRKHVETILKASPYPLTSLRAGIIVGSGSASFEIIRDLVEKLPIMIAPKWVSNKCQPIAIADVIAYLLDVLGHSKCLGKTFDIGGPEILTYKEMLLRFAKHRKLKRVIISVPFLTPRLSSYWLFFITSTSFSLAMALVDSLKNNAICRDNTIHDIFPKPCLTYEEALSRAFQKIEENGVTSTWMDALSSTNVSPEILNTLEAPKDGCVQFKATRTTTKPPDQIIKSIFEIGGKKGWYSMNWAWRLRGLFDRLIGGVGIQRGKAARGKLHPGDAIDFWRVLIADENAGRLLLYAEMKLPGEAWLDINFSKPPELFLTATFRPRGLLGRLYWYLMYPAHCLIFPGMLRHINASKT